MARLATTSDAFNAVAEPQRRHILDLLAQGERSVNEIAALLELKQPQVSNHLRVLREVELVSVRELGQQRLYRLQGEGLKPVHDWVKPFEHLWRERFDRLADYLKEWQTQGDRMQKITPFLWFDDNAEEAANFYVSVFKNSKILSVTRQQKDGPHPEGATFTVSFQLDGQEFTALNGGPHFIFTEAISLFVNCETQEEVDELWEKLTEGGEESRCGWLRDKYGLSWQIIPTILGELLQDKDPTKSGRVMQAMLQMSKIDIKALQQAYDAA
ncbi:MAG: metalloregulator ArsR/SmtB family transcription factor [Anaerolineae bacterium]|nr:metalloregulator ArsR/SmtB family transcription factor [Anaerolineae bacterium]